MALDESRTAGESGHLADHNSLHDFYNAAVTAGAFDEATGTYKDTSLSMPMTLDPRMGSGTGADVASADRCVYQRIGFGSATITAIALEVTASSGNIAVALYSNNGSDADAASPDARQATSGSVACPATGRAEVSLGGSADAKAGDWFAISADNVTATFRAPASAGASNLLAGLTAYELSAHPPPASATPAASTSRVFYLMGAV